MFGVFFQFKYTYIYECVPSKAMGQANTNILEISQLSVKLSKGGVSLGNYYIVYTLSISSYTSNKIFVESIFFWKPGFITTYAESPMSLDRRCPLGIIPEWQLDFVCVPNVSFIFIWITMAYPHFYQSKDWNHPYCPHRRDECCWHAFESRKRWLGTCVGTRSWFGWTNKSVGHSQSWV